MAHLSIQTGPAAGRSIVLSEAGSIVGREEGRDCDVGLGGRSVSSRHARIYYDGSRSAWVVRDLGSVNGTRVNGMPVDLAVLQDGSRISFADIDADFSERAAAQPPVGDDAWSVAPAPVGSSIDPELFKQIQSNVSFLKSISQGADIYIQQLEVAVDQMKAAMRIKDPAQGFMAAARIVESGQLDELLENLRGVRQAEGGVLENLEDLVGNK